MPHRGRSARSKQQDWGRLPGRRDERAADITADQAAALPVPSPDRLPPARKDTRAWCKGKAGRAHQLAIVEDTSAYRRPCQWVPEWIRSRHRWEGAAWSCRHQEECTECGKIMRASIQPAECPAFPGPGDPARLEAIAAARKRDETVRASRRRWRPAPDGPQGYRRPKAGQ